MARLENMKAPGREDRITVEAIVEPTYERVLAAFDAAGQPIALETLTNGDRRRLAREVRAVENVLRAFGKLDCPHGKYLPRDICGDCFAPR